MPIATPILSIETALGAASVCVWQQGAVRATWEAESSFHNAKTLLTGIDSVLKNASLTYADLGAVACSVGPGSFTGLRIGLSAARAIRLATGLPLIPVNTLEATLAAAPEAAKGWVMLDAARGQVYAQAFEGAQMLGSPTLVDYAEAAALVDGGVCLGNAAQKLQEAAKVNTAAWQNITPSAVEIAIVAAANEARAKDEASPLYVRAPDAKLPTKRPA